MAEHYFQSVRLLTYQLLYSPSTRSNTSYPIPLLTLVPTTLSKRNRQRLTSDGAILVDPEPLNPTESTDDAEKLAALRLWVLTQWHKICFIDARALVLEPRIEGVFVDRAATLPVLAKGGNEAGAELPEDYLFAGLPVRNPGPEKGEVGGEGQRVGADLFVLRPDKVAFRYFQDLLRMPGRFMEGGEEDGREGGVFGKLLNYAFRRDGGMPWGALWRGWSKEVELGLGKGVKVEGWEYPLHRWCV